MHFARVLLRRGRPADNCPYGNQGRLIGYFLCFLDSTVELLHVFDILARFVPVHYLNVPAVSLVTFF